MGCDSQFYVPTRLDGWGPESWGNALSECVCEVSWRGLAFDSEGHLQQWSEHHPVHWSPKGTKRRRKGNFSLSSWAGTSVFSWLWIWDLLVLRPSNLDRMTNFLVLQSADGGLWDFSTSINMQASSHNELHYLYLSLASYLCPSFCPSIHPSLHPSTHPSTYPSIIYLYVSLSICIYLSIYLHPSIHPSICLPIYICIIYLSLSIYISPLSIYISPSIHPSFPPSIHPPIHLCIYYLSLYISVSIYIWYLSLYLSVYIYLSISIHPSTHLSIYLSNLSLSICRGTQIDIYSKIFTLWPFVGNACCLLFWHKKHTLKPQGTHPRGPGSERWGWKVRRDGAGLAVSPGEAGVCRSCESDRWRGGSGRVKQVQA